MQLKTQRLRIYGKRNMFCHQNLIFKREVKKIYREIGKKPITVDDVSSIEEVKDFWKNI